MAFPQECWAILFQNDVDHDVARTPLNLELLGTFASEADAKAFLAEREPDMPLDPWGDPRQHLQSGFDNYWLLQVWG